MTPSLRRKLEALAERHEEVGRLLADPGVMADNTAFRNLSREYSQLAPVADGRHSGAGFQRLRGPRQPVGSRGLPASGCSNHRSGLCPALPRLRSTAPP